MNLRRLLTDLVRVIVDEAEHNPDFRSRIAQSLGQAKPNPVGMGPARKVGDALDKPGKRRTAAALDPIEVAAMGEMILRARLADLTLDQLQDVVAEYGMDPGRLVSKWKTRQRVIDRVVEIAIARSQKGDAFRSKP